MSLLLLHPESYINCLLVSRQNNRSLGLSSPPSHIDQNKEFEFHSRSVRFALASLPFISQSIIEHSEQSTTISDRFALPTDVLYSNLPIVPETPRSSILIARFDFALLRKPSHTSIESSEPFYNISDRFSVSQLTCSPATTRIVRYFAF